MSTFSLVPSPDGTGSPRPAASEPEEPGALVGAEAAPVQRPTTTTGTVVRIDDGIASVVVGPEREPWDFPLEMLPDTVGVDTVLVLERVGRTLRFVELDPVTEVVRGRPFDLRLRRTARKVPYMRTAAGADHTARRAQ
jgi:hypothetical protein